MAACLWGGESAFASHRSAAALYSLDGLGRGPIEITIVGTGGRSADGMIIHRSIDPLTGQTRHARGIPTTEITRTLLDIAAVVDVEVAEQALDDALRRGLVSIDSVTRRLARIGGNGRRGAKKLRRLIDEGSNGAKSDSTLETRIGRILKRHGIMPPKTLYNVFEEEEFIAEVDYAWPNIKLAIECDSRRFHTGAKFFEDLRRRNRLIAAGWEVIHATWRDVQDGGAVLVPQIRLLLGQRSLNLGS